MKRRKDQLGGGDFFNEMDISQAMRGWAFEPGQVNVRLIRGNDGKPKLQLRLDLGLLQMELEGRPDGKRPHRASTELDYQRKKLISHTKRQGSENGFLLNPRDCQALREESAMFYHRYLSLFVLEQYDAVVRDTQHNLDVLDLCRRYGKNEYDRMCLEQYRPYIVMMNVRAKGCESLRLGYVKTAIAYLRGGLKQIAHMAPREHRKKFLHDSNEAHILRDMLKQIREQLPPDPRDVIKKKLKEAVTLEHYEEAAQLRDQLAVVSKEMLLGIKNSAAMPASGAQGPGAGAPKKRRIKKDNSGRDKSGF